MTEGPIADRIEQFHDALREKGDASFVDATADEVVLDEHIGGPEPLTESMASIIAERNRLFWASFLEEEAGEVASALTDGEPPSDFEEEVADVVIVCYGIADAVGFDLDRAVHRKQDKNDKKVEAGTGKMPTEAREEWDDG